MTKKVRSSNRIIGKKPSERRFAASRELSDPMDLVLQSGRDCLVILRMSRLNDLVDECPVQ
jgi:hypothetical protein